MTARVASATSFPTAMPGEELFKGRLAAHDPLCHRIGARARRPVYRRHLLRGLPPPRRRRRQAGGLKHNVTTFTLHQCKALVKEGVVHSFGW